jgi:type IV pilus assembly protein PilY1
LNLSSSERSTTVEPLSGAQDIKFLWSSTSWLNAMSDADVVVQRSVYNATTANRFIQAFADKDSDMVVDTGELQNFVWPPNPAPSADLSGTTDFYSYLTLYRRSQIPRPRWQICGRIMPLDSLLC